MPGVQWMISLSWSAYAEVRAMFKAVRILLECFLVNYYILFLGLGKMFADSFAILAMSVGSKTGLMDKLLAYDQPKTCKEIADDAGLKERLSNLISCVHLKPRRYYLFQSVEVLVQKSQCQLSNPFHPRPPTYSYNMFHLVTSFYFYFIW